jgi:selenocysteine lyase/cysteine desulfurase
MQDLLLNTYYELSNSIIRQLTYEPGTISTPFFDKLQILYADFIASGLPSPIIENYLQKQIYPFYSNTHSNAHNGIQMKNTINLTKTYIRESMNLNQDYQILFTGSGTTGAINHLTNCIDYNNYMKIIIYLSIYEHYSNHLPWVELANQNPNIQIHFIPFGKNIQNQGIIDVDWLNESITNIYNNLDKSKSDRTLVICSISACSNINGMINPLDKIKLVLDKFPTNKYFYKYFFADYACSAPYVKIDGSLFDAFFFSPHKFIGGMSTPGLLIGRSCIFSKPKPFCTGGGCVKNASMSKVIYETDIEKKESAGTPNIIGIIKLWKVLQLKDKFQPIITHNENILSKIIKSNIKYFESTYPTFRSVLSNDNIHHLPILSFNISNLHYNFIVVLFNDLFGIQTRGGIGCCGILAEYIEQMYKFRGWVRISFHWLMTKKMIINIFEALEYIIKNGHKYLKYYNYDTKQNLYKSIK